MFPSPPVPRLRLLLFGAAFVWINAGPIWMQLWGQPYTKWLRSWQMYSGYGTDLCEVRYFTRQADGTEAPLDRHEVMGINSAAQMPRSWRWIKNRDHVRDVGRSLCGALPGPDADVRAQARCATRRGWKKALDGRQNLCAVEQTPEPDPKKRRRKRRGKKP